MGSTDRECRHEAGVMRPVIDRNRCEGKEECIRVCPYDVFEIGLLSVEDRRKLSFVGRLKAFAHRGRQAFAVRAETCHGCGLCVTACPEHAIALRRVDDQIRGAGLDDSRRSGPLSRGA